jgi:hypothetical protein
MHIIDALTVLANLISRILTVTCSMPNIDTEAHPRVHFPDMPHHNVRVAKFLIFRSMVVDSDVDGIFL